MALVKWNKYAVTYSNYYYNQRSVSQFEYNYSHDGSQYVSGYDGWGFDSDVGFYEDGNYISDVSVFSVTSTAVYIDQTVESQTVPGFYSVDRYKVQECDVSSTPSKGTFIGEVTAEEGTYPDDGVYGSYWYVKVGAGFPGIKMEVDNAVVTSIDGWVKIAGSLKKITDIWVKVGDSAKKAL